MPSNQKKPTNESSQRVDLVVDANASPCPLTYGSLFAGIGGFDLGFDRAGLSCAWQVEKDPYAQKVLAKHWPNVRRWDDVCTFPPEPASDWSCDVICGGFPCQPISVAGRGRQEKDSRWLWPEMLRAIRVLRPRFAVIENVPALLVRGFHGILCDLAAIGLDAEWSTISSCALGAPHMRRRLFVVAYASGSVGDAGLWIREPGETRTLQRCDARTAQVLRMESAHRDRGAFNGLAARVGPAWRCVGNAVDPDISEYIGKQLLNAMEGSR